MTCTNEYIFISFNKEERFIRILPNGTELLVPEFFEYKDEYGMPTGKLDRNLNELETNPQVGYVLAENPRYNLKCGDKIFMHYLAIQYQCEVNGQKGAFIDGNSVFFRDNGGIEMMPSTYLGEQLFDEIPQTPSGIYLGHLERKKECYIRLTYVPYGSALKPGEVVFTIDGAQYPVKYGDMRCVKLMEHEIVAKANNGQLIPVV